MVINSVLTTAQPPEVAVGPLEAKTHCGFECTSYGEVSVPVSYAVPDGEKICLHYHLNIPHSGHPKGCVLMITGWQLTLSWWQFQVGALTSAGYEVCTFDNRGCGLSGSPRGRYNTDIMARDALALLDHLKWDGASQNIHIVGLSMGGMIAQKAVALSPIRFTSAAFLATHGGFGVNSKLPQWSFVMHGLARLFHSLIGTVRVGGNNTVVDESSRHNANARYDLKMNYGKGFLDEKGVEYFAKLWDARRRGTNPQAAHAVVGQLLAVFGHTVSKAELVAIRDEVSTLVVHGSSDIAVRPGCAHDLGKAICSEPIVIEGAGHLLMDDAAEELNRILLSHIGAAMDGSRSRD